MPYVTTNPPRCTNQQIGGENGTGFRSWTYQAADTAAAVAVSGYFTDGYDLGMREGHVVILVDTTAAGVPIVSHHTVMTSTKTGGVDLSLGTILSGTNLT